MLIFFIFLSQNNNNIILKHECCLPPTQILSRWRMKHFIKTWILLTVYVLFLGGPRLKGQDVVLHFLKIIKNPNYNQHIGVEYCKLLKSAISVSVYQCDISVKTWQGILSCIITVTIT